MIVLGSEVAHESPWQITSHFFFPPQGNGLLGENQKKPLLFILRAVVWAARNHGYGPCREAPTHHAKYIPGRFVT